MWVCQWKRQTTNNDVEERKNFWTDVFKEMKTRRTWHYAAQSVICGLKMDCEQLVTSLW